MVTASYQRTRYPVTAPEPADEGVTHVTFAQCAGILGKVTDNERGSVGAPAVTAVVDTDAVEVLPPELVAFTVNVYCVPFVSPDTVQARGAALDLHVCVAEDTFDVAVTT